MNKTKEEKEEKKRRKGFIWFLIAICVIAAIPGTYAWFKHAAKRVNKFTSGEVKHEILENFKTTGSTLDILPGETINKDVFIHNTAKSNALLRVKVTPVWIDQSGNQTPVDANDVTLIFAADIATNWTKGKDGYYYYNHILEPHDSSLAHPAEGSITKTNIVKCHSKQLLDAVQLNKTVTDQAKYANKVFDIIVESETLQINLEAAKDEWNINNDATILTMITKLVTSYNANR